MRDGPTIGLVGCGEWGRHVLRDLVHLGCEVVVVARSGASRERAATGRAAAIVAEVGELPGLDGAVVVAPPAARPAIVEQLLERVPAVFTEKPLAADAAVATRLCERGDGRLFVMDKWRHHPGVRLLASIARSGELGRVVSLESRRLGWGNPHGDVDAIWNLAPHDLAIVQEVLGLLPGPRWAAAELDRGGPSGLLGVLGTGPIAVVEVSARHPERRREVRLACDDGVAVLSGDADHVLVARDGQDARQRERRDAPGPPPLLAELEAFIAYLRGGPPPASSAVEAAAAVGALAELRRLAGLDGG